MRAKHIHEVPIYDGAMKDWRVLNLNTGTFYSMHFDSFEDADASIEHGVERAGLTVKRQTLSSIVEALDASISH